MTQTETEQEDARLKAAGFDSGASPEDALVQLRGLRQAPGVTPGAVARALGAIATPEAAANLVEMETTATGAARREVRRALFRLRQRGIEPPAAGPGRERPAAMPSATPGLTALFSPIDAEGARVIWLLKERRGGGIARLWGLISDAEGLINVSLNELSRRELRAERAAMERRAGVKLVEGDARLADYILCDAFRRTPPGKRTHVGNFLTLRMELIGSPPPAEIEHPIYAEMASALDLEPSPELLKQPEIAALALRPQEIKPYVDEIKSIRESVLVLNPMQQEDRVNTVIARAAGEIFAGDRATTIRRRLEDIAYYMARSGRCEAAGWAAAAAARIREGADLARVPFFQALLRSQLGAVFAEEQAHEREEPRLIMTPAEAMRAQQQRQSRSGRR